MKVPFTAMRPLGAFVSVLGFAVAAIESSTARNSFQLVFEFLVRSALAGGKDQVVGIGTGLASFLFLESCDQ